MINNNPESKPQVGEYATIRYNFPRSASIKGDWEELSLATVEGRVTVNLDIPECYRKYLDWEVRESNLLFKSGELYFHFTLAKEVSTRPKREGFKVLGVDLGVNKVAVTSDGDFYGKKVKRKRRKRDKFVAELQAKGTRAAHNRLKAKSGEWKRFMIWVNHNISRRIVDKLDRGDVLVMEDLTGIRESAKYNEWVHKWAFKQLQKFLEYKATLKGIRVVYVNPRNTSKRCSKCGSPDTERHGGFFKCNNCGFTLDADLNGARNIAQRYTRNLGLRVARRSAHDLRDHEPKAPIRRIEGESTQKLYTPY